MAEADASGAPASSCTSSPLFAACATFLCRPEAVVVVRNDSDATLEVRWSARALHQDGRRPHAFRRGVAPWHRDHASTRRPAWSNNSSLLAPSAASDDDSDSERVLEIGPGRFGECDLLARRANYFTIAVVAPARAGTEPRAPTRRGAPVLRENVLRGPGGDVIVTQRDVAAALPAVAAEEVLQDALELRGFLAGAVVDRWREEVDAGFGGGLADATSPTGVVAPVRDARRTFEARRPYLPGDLADRLDRMYAAFLDRGCDRLLLRGLFCGGDETSSYGDDDLDDDDDDHADDDHDAGLIHVVATHGAGPAAGTPEMVALTRGKDVAAASSDLVVVATPAPPPPPRPLLPKAPIVRDPAAAVAVFNRLRARFLDDLDALERDHHVALSRLA
mmetsp:Transcript_18939/g.75533  ORF Transcript_18939/g.75533 Transcript_18939/m.75533 type:complete len:391 (+) Transcript_18939:2-1174(+)